MRVIGGKDYYDGARAYGEDSDIVFSRTDHRKSQLVDLPYFTTIAPTLVAAEPDPTTWSGQRYLWLTGDLRRSGQYRYRYQGVEYRYGRVSVVFAGKIIHGVRFECTVVSTLTKSNAFFWDYATIKRFAASIGLTTHISWNSSERQQAEHFTGLQPLSQPHLDHAITNQVVIAIHDTIDNATRFPGEKGDWHVNTDGLKGVQFAKIVDPYQAYQELAMYVGGVLPRQPNDTVELKGEKIMVQKHGMDKWSFRKQPEGYNGK